MPNVQYPRSARNSPGRRGSEQEHVETGHLDANVRGCSHADLILQQGIVQPSSSDKQHVDRGRGLSGQASLSKLRRMQPTSLQHSWQPHLGAGHEAVEANVGAGPGGNHSLPQAVAGSWACSERPKSEDGFCQGSGSGLAGCGAPRHSAGHLDWNCIGRRAEGETHRRA